MGHVAAPRSGAILPAEVIEGTTSSFALRGVVSRG
jgi:hypothetical protein